MANSILAEIGLNDTIQDIVRKCNSNFKRLALNQSKQSRSDIRQESSRTDSAINDAEARLNAALAGAIGEINAALESAITSIQNNLVPPTGTYIISDYDPGNQYPNTEWKKITPAPLDNIDIWHRIA